MCIADADASESDRMRPIMEAQTAVLNSIHHGVSQEGGILSSALPMTVYSAVCTAAASSSQANLEAR